jgi:VanZ family protein
MASLPDGIPMLNLRYRPFWIAASAVLVLGVVWGSLQTVLGGEVPQGLDKVEHFGTYLFLAVWFTGLMARKRWWLVAVTLLLLGAMMEAGQYAMQAGRAADVNDMAANVAGIAAGLLLAALLTGGWAQRVESWLR